MPDLRLFPDHESLSHAAAQYVLDQARQAVTRRGRFLLVLTGGSSPRRLYELLATDAQMPWERTHLFWGDERFVPQDSDESNYRLAVTHLLAHIQIPEANVHPIPTDVASPDEAAAAYEATLRRYFPDADRPDFDLVLLGLGADGHVASLFPDAEPWAEPSGRWVRGVTGPAYHPPRERVTLTFPALNGTRHALFIVHGEQKAGAAADVLRPTAKAARLPAHYVRPTGELVWMLDEAAAVKLDA